MVHDQLKSCRRAFVEIALIFGVFCLQGPGPAPDVNESHYLAKAIHYWNPDWIAGDFFLTSADTHKVFYFAFGWLSLWLSPMALIWTGRILIWLLLAWAWRRLSVALVPRHWYSVLTAALFVCLMDRCHMAGEWVIGGVEAKGFAYVFVFLALESLVRNRWNVALVLLGAASAFHVLVGGWAAVATALAWLWLKRSPRIIAPVTDATAACGFAAAPPPLCSLWPGMLGGLLLALPGLLPALNLDRGVDSATASLAHQIYVFERLPHHLTLAGIRPDFILRLALLWGFWLFLGHWSRSSHPALPPATSCPTANQPLAVSPAAATGDDVLRLRAFVTGAVIITLIGPAIQPLIYVDCALAANVLRYYWFRLTDVALPLGVALEAMALVAGAPPSSFYRRRTKPLAASQGTTTGTNLPEDALGTVTLRFRRGWLALAILIAAFHLGDRALDRVAPSPPSSHRIGDSSLPLSQRWADFEDWRAACHWVAASGEIPPGARFLVPRMSQTFKWYAGHSDVVNWKDVPQDAKSVVAWWDRVRDIYGTGLQPPDFEWYDSLAEGGADRLNRLGAKYGADYVLTQLTEPPLDLPVVHRNTTYIIYRLR